MTSTNNIIKNYPVSSSLLKGYGRNGVIASLVGMAPLDQIVISGETPSLPHNYKTELGSYSIDASMAYNLGVGGLVGFKGTGSVHYLLKDFSARVSVDRNDDSIITTEHYAVGFRIAVKAWDLKTTASVSLESIAADCTLNGSKSAIQIDVFGLSAAQALDAMPGLSSISNTFDMRTLQDLGYISVVLTEYISNNYASLTPSLVAVDLDLPRITSGYLNSASTLLGTSGIYQGNDLTKTLNKAPDNSKLPTGVSIEPSMVKNMYEVILGADVTNRTTPTGSQKSAGHKSCFRGE